MVVFTFLPPNLDPNKLKCDGDVRKMFHEASSSLRIGLFRDSLMTGQPAATQK